MQPIRILSLLQVIMTRDGQEERPLAAAFAESLQSAAGAAARDRERRSAAESALAEDPNDDPAGADGLQKTRTSCTACNANECDLLVGDA